MQRYVTQLFALHIFVAHATYPQSLRKQRPLSLISASIQRIFFLDYTECVIIIPTRSKCNIKGGRHSTRQGRKGSKSYPTATTAILHGLEKHLTLGARGRIVIFRSSGALLYM